jgi:hypothetical protein
MKNGIMYKYNLFFLSFILTLISIITVPAQKIVYPKNSPEWLIDMFFKQTHFPEKEKYLFGEMLRDVNYPTIGEELNGRANVIFRKVELDNRIGVYSVVVKDNGSIANFYSYLINVSGTWKIEAVRKFQLPKFVYSVVDSLSQISNLPDSSSSLLKMLKLVTGTDDDLKLYLSDNINDFYNAVGAFENQRKEDLKILMDKLNMDSIFMDQIYPQCIFILLGGFGRLEVGYIYCTNKSAIPKVSPERFIYIEEVLPNWYVYRAM